MDQASLVLQRFGECLKWPYKFLKCPLKCLKSMKSMWPYGWMFKSGDQASLVLQRDLA